MQRTTKNFLRRARLSHMLNYRQSYLSAYSIRNSLYVVNSSIGNIFKNLRGSLWLKQRFLGPSYSRSEVVVRSAFVVAEQAWFELMGVIVGSGNIDCHFLML